MPRKARDERLDTRTARLKLAPRREPYWRPIQEGRAIGYRRLNGGRAGSWIARYYVAAEGRSYQALGTADDLADADGVTTLTFSQAQDKAHAWFRTALDGGQPIEAPLSVRAAVEHYITDYSARGGKALAATRITFDAHVLPTLGDRLVSALTAAIIRGWHRSLAEAPARLRSPKAGKKGSRKVETDDTDGRRARRATANRILTGLKAALNLAYREGRVSTDDAWRRVQPFPKVDAPRVRYLTDDEVTRLVNACPADLRTLVSVALLTGCRYGELGALHPADVDLAAGVLSVRESKGGRSRRVVLTDEAVKFFKARMAGRDGTKPFLLRDDGGVWGKSHQFRPLREACGNAKISPAVSFHILRHTHASRLAGKGVPMAVIAEQLGHSDVKLTTRHYAHLSPGYVADTIRAAFGSLGLVPDTNVRTMRDKTE